MSRVRRIARLEVFLGSMGAVTSREPKQSLDITSRRSEAVDLPAASAYGLVPGRPTPGSPTLLRHPIAQTPHWWCGNINPLSIAYAFQQVDTDLLAIDAQLRKDTTPNINGPLIQ
jgi:hypothetical protein